MRHERDFELNGYSFRTTVMPPQPAPSWWRRHVVADAPADYDAEADEVKGMARWKVALIWIVCFAVSAVLWAQMAIWIIG